MLFEGMMKYGFGNWGDIAQHLNSGKTARQIRKYYRKYYLLQPNRLPLTIEPISRMSIKDHKVRTKDIIDLEDE